MSDDICRWCDDCLLDFHDNPTGRCSVTGGHDPDAPEPCPKVTTDD